ncbi:MAG: DUF1045 domain-containing protein [Burkholderiaceae bacterium]
MTTSNQKRYALYFAPSADHPLWVAGCTWLGRDAQAGKTLSPPARPEVSTPWRYGFHATLKAPLRLQPGLTENDFLQAVQAWASHQPAFLMPALEVAELGDFLALRPTTPPAAGHPLRRLADACVLELDPWRAALTEAQQRRYLQPHLTPGQQGHVERLGYAHVLEDWRFHMTWSTGLSAPERAALRPLAEAHFTAALGEPLWCGELCVFTEGAAEAPFFLTQRFAMGGTPLCQL